MAKWDITRLAKEEGADARAAWTETFPARALGMALAAQEDFWKHVEAVRRGGDPLRLAHRYVRRDQGRRVELIAAYLSRAAAGLEFGRTYAKVDVWNIAPRVWVVGASVPRDPQAPRRALRNDAAGSMARAALRVARRGAGRCADPDCGVADRDKDANPWLSRTGRKLAHNPGDYCRVCAPRQPRYGRSDIEAERVLFDRAIAAVLGGDSRARRRRVA